MKVENSYLAWEGPSWQLRVEQLELPGGERVERGYIEHPGAVALVPVQETVAGIEVLMLRQYRAALGETILELPAGTRHSDESWEECAQRELREETGFQAGTLTPLGRIWPAPGVSSEEMAIYLADDLSPAPLPGDADEEIAVAPMPFAELWEMIHNGRIRDAKSIVALWRVALHRGYPE